MSAPLNTPQEDAERIRLKRLARLGGGGQASPAASGSTSTPATPPAAPKPVIAHTPVTALPKPKPIVKPAAPASPAPEPAKPSPVKQSQPVPLNFPQWESETLGKVFNVTLDREQAEKSGWTITWLRGVRNELLEEDPARPQPIPLEADLADRLIIDRLSLDPRSPTDDPELLTVLVGYPHWKPRWDTLPPPLADLQRATQILDKLRELVVSYAGFTLQDPGMFPQPEGVVLGAQELLPSLLSLSSAPLNAGSTELGLGAGDVEAFIGDLAKRFADDGMDEIFGPIITMVIGALPAEGLGSGGSEWRAVVGALEALVSDKNVAMAFPRLPNWLPEHVTPHEVEFASLLGPLARMGIFGREWPALAQSYYPEPDKRTSQNAEAVDTTLRATLVNLQQSLFLVFNAIVRASADSRERVLKYFSTVLNINVKRAGAHVDPRTVASDAFMINLQAALLRFAEPFLDAKYSKIDRIDAKYFAMTTRINLAEETRLKATAEEVNAWEQRVAQNGVTPQNFISDIFFLCAGYNHLGIIRTIATHGEILKHLGEIDKWLETAEAAEVPPGPQQTLHQARIERVKNGRPYAPIPEQTHDSALAEQVPDEFRILPEYFVEDVVDYYIYIMKYRSDLLDTTLRTEFLVFALTFLSSTWYIKNPFLKSKILQGLFYGSIHIGRERDGLLGALFNSHPLALQHLFPSLMWFYVEVEQTGASTQFYDKFESRRNIAYILRGIWNNPNHRDTLLKAAEGSDKFVRFANLLMNDATYLLDELLTKLAAIKQLQQLMANKEQWDALPAEERREKEKNFRQYEGMAASYATLGKSTVGLLRDFTKETKAAFLRPEIVDRLAAMLSYNIDMLCGPRCSSLHVKDMEKYRFQPRALLGEIFQIFLNLSGEAPFIQAVASEGRSYKKEVFLNAAGIVRKHSIKSETEIEKFVAFIQNVEEAKVLIEQEDDLGDAPDEFMDPLMYTLMRDPVILPSSKATVDRSTIKAHLLSDTTDPFNRSPLKIEEVVPDVELKAKIETWLAERRDGRLKEALENAAVGTSEIPMEVDEAT
ncbi:ubiquitin conjugation factor E4 [Rhizoctonia solani]|uniref:RING-type E3 ubiquitin transferase n=1 Tax=Rhizoctonia solani TaxID=456999 RepID=A0A8H8NWX0_9AGAM|nr:ubiquitin conjugation factor E4 [Rhizoctonia solani]QRW20227.1 ubiquitin conjugation factor E4 [Rhizoctonia solani]